MKRNIIVYLFLLLLSFGVKAYSFLATNSQGVNVYYSIVSSSNKTARVTYDGSSYSAVDEYSGHVLLESVVKNSATNEYFVITGIASNAFNGSSVQSVTIGKTLTSVASGSFKNCSLLEKVVIEGYGVVIAGNAFQNCTSLDTVVCKSMTPPSLSSNSFSGVATSMVVVVPCGALAAYQSDTRWGVFNIVEEGELEPSSFSASIVQGESFTYGGVDYTSAGNYTLNTTLPNGCTLAEDMYIMENTASSLPSCNASIVPGNDSSIMSFATLVYPLTTDIEADYYRWSAENGSLSSTDARNVDAYIEPNHTATFYLEAIYDGDSPNLIYNGDFELGAVGFGGDYENTATGWDGTDGFHLGQYMVVNNTTLADNTLPECSSDNFLIASVLPNRDAALYRANVKNLKANGDYSLGFDMINLETTSSKAPNLGVYVNGVYKGSAKAENNGCVWNHFNFVFSLGATTEAVIELRDSTIVPHYTYVDNVVFKEMCVARDTIVVDVHFDNENCDVSITPGDSTIISFKTQPLAVTLGTDHEARYYNWSTTGSGVLSSTTAANPIVTIPSGTSTQVMVEVLYENNENLIPNGDFEQGNTGFTSAYTYATNQTEYLSGTRWGKYMITSTPTAFESAWTNCSNADGLYLIADGSMNPNTDFYSVTVNGLSANTEYALSFDVTQLITNNSDNAVLQFKVNGTAIGTPDTLAPQTCQWKHYYTVVNSGNSTSMTISLTDLNTVQNNNDFALDNVSLKQICRAYDTITLTYIHDDYCEVNILPDVTDTLIFSAGTQSIELSTDRVADYFKWIGEGLSTTNQQSTTATIPFGETRQYIVEAMTESDQNLIANGDFEQGNTGFTSQLTYQANPGVDLPEGYYTVTNIPHNFHNGFVSCGHDGKMMVANGSPGLNTYVYQKVVPVEQHKRYVVEFETSNASFVTAENTLTKFQFSINDVQLGPIVTILPTGCEWTSFYEIWDSGESTVAQIKILNQNTQGNGNDFCLDNISFRELCVARDTINVSTMYYYFDTIQATICEGTLYNDGVFIKTQEGIYTDTISSPLRDTVRTLELSVIPRSYDTIYPIICDNDVFVFNGKAYPFAGEYRDTLTCVETGCDSVVTIYLTVNPTFHDTITAEICDEESYTDFGFDANATGLYTLDLQSIEGCDSTSTLILVVRDKFLDTLNYQIYRGDTFTYYGFNECDSGSYTITYQNQYGCDSTYILNLSVIELLFPNLVTPNADGINEVFEIHNLLEQTMFEETELLIYNRYGKKIYSKKNISSYEDFWDPNETNTPSGTYFYRFKAKGFEKVLDFNGVIEVMR